MNKTYVDPPSGWRYGFPKFFTEQPQDFNKWLLDNGYPQSEIDLWPQGVPCGMYIISDEEEQNFNRGLRKCGLCGCWDWPVNHHDDCSICSKAQYGDE